MPYYTPDNLKFGGGLSDTLLHPAVLVALLIALPLIFAVRRERLLLIVLPLGLLIPNAQQIVVGGVHVLVLRLLVLAGFVRALTSDGLKQDRLNAVFVIWVVARASAFVLTFQELAAVVNQIGFIWDALCGFFFLRFAVRTRDDVERAIRLLAYIAMVVALCMLCERVTRINVFGYLGGVPLAPELKAGSVRAQGPFSHGLLAGTFGASLLPLFVWLWMSGRVRALAAGGVIASTVITVAAASSTPIVTYACAAVGIAMWPVREHLRYIRWSAILIIFALAMAMNRPVWFLLARVDLTGGSSGYHRALLIDRFIMHIGDWWLIGTASNGSWGWDMWDTCNQFVTEGVTGGLLTLVCFVTLILILFRRLAKARRQCRSDIKSQWYFWLLTVTLSTHCVAFLGIVYFDQTKFLWYLVLAILIAASSPDAALTSSDRQAEGPALASCWMAGAPGPSGVKQRLEWYS